MSKGEAENDGQPASFLHSQSLTHLLSVSQSVTHSLTVSVATFLLAHSLTHSLRTVALSDCQRSAAQRSDFVPSLLRCCFVPSLLRCSFVVRRRLGDDSATTRRLCSCQLCVVVLLLLLLLSSSFVRSFVPSFVRRFVLSFFNPSFLPSFVRCWLLRCFVASFVCLPTCLFRRSFVRSLARSLVCLCEWRHCLRFPRRGRAVCVACVCAGGVLDAAAVFAATGCVDRLCCATEVNFGGTTCSCGRMSTCRLGSAALSLPECWRELGGSRVCAS
mgnify:CR=1 FL=1